jgi:hypothetical protein
LPVIVGMDDAVRLYRLPDGSHTLVGAGEYDVCHVPFFVSGGPSDHRYYL